MNEDCASPLPDGIRRIAVIGAGGAGRTFALRCATAGFEVVVEDLMPGNLRHAKQEFARLATEDTYARVTFASRIEDAVRDADVAVDFVPDELESKLEIFCLVDRMAPPKTLILTPSEAMSITDLASCTYRGDRCFAMRGGSDAVKLLHPVSASPERLRTVEAFLQRITGEVRVEADQDAPMLTKNLR